MKRILVIAPDCFPVTGAESIVNIKLLQALSESGQFSVDLVSRKRKWTNYPSDTIESFNVSLNSMSVIEVDNKVSIITVLQSIYTFFKFGAIFKGCHWALAALKRVLPLVRNNNYDYVLTKNTPSYLLGAYLKKKFGIKWVATWNDPYPYVKYPYPYGKGKSCKENFFVRREISIMRNADVHVFPSKRLCDYMLSYLRPDSCTTEIIPHVVLESKVNHAIREKTNELRLIHSGNLGNYRDPENLLIAFKRFLDSTKAAVSFTFMGKVNLSFHRIVQELNLDDFIKYKEPLEYKASLKELEHYDVAVILEANCNEGIFLPTKVSDFMQEKIPIFSVSPKIGVLNDLYQRGDVSYFATVSDVDSIYDALVSIYRDFHTGLLKESTCICDDYLSTAIVRKYIEM